MRIDRAQPGAEARAEARERLRETLQDVQRTVDEAHAGHPAGTTVAGGDGNVSVQRGDDGRIVVNTANGRTITIDPRAVASTQGQEAIIRQALVPPSDGRVPSERLFEQLIPLAGIMFGCITLMVLGLPLIRYWVRRLEGRAALAPPAGAALPAEWGSRLERIEQAVETMAVEVERVSEAQRFSARLLSERLPDALPKPPRAHVTPVR